MEPTPTVTLAWPGPGILVLVTRMTSFNGDQWTLEAELANHHWEFEVTDINDMPTYGLNNGDVVMVRLVPYGA